MNMTPPSILRLATSRSLGLCALFASILIFSGSASAELRILSWGESSSDSQLGGNYREKVPITENDQTYTANIETGEEYTRATTKISDEGIEQDVEFSWGLQFPENKWASSNVTIIFELTEPMYYDFSGEALFNDPYGSVTTFQATLGLGPSWEPFSNVQLSRGSIQPEKYVLGEQRGTLENTLDGASRGVLYAGMYFLRLYTSSSDYGNGDTNNIVGDQMNKNYQGPITCSSKIKLNFSPIPVDAKPVIDIDPIYYSLVNEAITINASPIEGYPEFEFEFEWYFNGELIERDRTKNPAFLTIDGSQNSVGEYRVVVYSNFETKTEKTFEYRNSPGMYLGDLTYAKRDGKVSIIDCDEGATGELVIPDTIEGNPVTSIGNSAFSGCSGLTSITIPDSVTSIGDRAFQFCGSLSTITFLGSAPTMGANVFSGVENGASAIISSQKKVSFGGIGTDWNGLTLNCLDGALCWLTWTTTGGEVTITDCDEASSGELVIPDTIEGNSVTSIGDGAFFRCDGLTSITIPDSVTSIGAEAFNRCTALTSITIPDGVTSIGYSAFSGCSGLTSITIGNSVTSIGEFAFSDCSSLTSITIPDGVTSIEDYAFAYCSASTSITIPDSVTSIGVGAFEACQSLTSIAIPDGVTSIGVQAFSGCGSLTSITIPDGITIIEDYAFSGCNSLTSLTIPDSVTSIGVGAFWGCTSLTSITIPDSVTSIRDRAFQHSSSLSTITFLGSAPTMGANVFSNVENGASAVIPGGKKASFGDIGNSWNGLTLNCLDGALCWLTWTTTGGEVTITDCDEAASGELVIPDTIEGNPVTSIGKSAFSQCKSLTSITIPDGVTSIGLQAFFHCDGLTSITIPNSVTSIGVQAFVICTNLTSITIPDGVTSIGASAFSQCTSLTSITIPESVTSIGAEAFNRCTSLTSITIPDSVISVGFGTFSQCTSLTNIAIPDSVTSIGDYAFGTCKSLTNITIPDSVTSIGEFAFVDCISLMEVVLVGPAPEVQSDAFTSTADGVLAFAKTEHIESYGGDRASWEGLTVREISSPPLLNLESFYESAPSQSLEIDALNFPTNYSTTTYQWFFNGFPIPEKFGGNSPKITIDGLTSSNGSWSVTATNFLGESTATFEYRVFVDTDSDGFSDYREQNLTGTNFELADTDSDGLNDYQELIVFETDPTDSDSDDDGYLDGQEQGEGTDPNQAESYPQRTLTVPTVENGSVVGADTYALGAEAVLTATPSPGYVFASWNGDSTATGNPLTIMMEDNQSIGATFSQDTRDPDEDGLSNYQEIVVFGTNPTDSDSDDDGYLDGQEQGEGTDPNQAESYPQRTLTVPTVENGSVSGGGSYALGVTATLTATPATGYVFISWNSAIKNPLTITMDTNQSISAIFGPDTRDPDGDGLSNYQELVLFKTDPADSDSDDDGYPDGQEQIERTDPNEAESYPQRALTVPTVENGSVSGGGSYALGVTATLTATPAIGYVFTSWSGGSTATDNPLTITMDDEQSVGAIFSQDTRDPDADGLNNYQELVLFNTDPADSDSDDDGYPDGQEQDERTNPNEAESYPQRNLTVPTVENGSVSGGGSYALGVTATLTATPAIGYVFTSWSGGSTATDNPLTITMDDEQSVGAIFSQDTRDPDEDGLSNYQELVLFKTDPADSDSDDDGFSDGQEQGEGTDPNEAESFPTRVLTINDSANGTFTGGGVYQLGVTATLQAIPDTGYLFGGWVGEVIGESNPLSITMLVNQSVGANFEQDTRDSDEDGLSNYQELVVFNTDPTDSDSDDDGYLDGQEQTEGTDPNESNSYPTRSLATERVNNGSISGSGTYALGEEVVVTANPDPGFIFSWWSGNASGSVNPLAVIMTSNLSIGAAFVPDNRDNDGDGLSNFSELKIHNTDPNKFDSDGDGFSDGLEISERTNPNVSSLFPTRTIGISDSANGFVEGGGTYPLGVTIEVTATPSAGYLFFKWVGDVDGTENPLSLKISSNLNLEAIFQQDERDSDLDGLSNYQEIIVYNTDPNNPDSDGDGFNDGLEISEETNPNVSSVFPTRSLLVVAPLNGSVNSQAIYPLDAIATLTATPEPGYVFYSWGGDTIGSQNPLPVVMSENRILSAIFNQDE
ncbi:leucine-rich repeat protein, partial [Akkermansiaceae bacterium]|nr:leucine-rich repeat protein [Akkermansiaceae bacterium]